MIYKNVSAIKKFKIVISTNKFSVDVFVYQHSQRCRKVE